MGTGRPAARTVGRLNAYLTRISFADKSTGVKYGKPERVTGITIRLDFMEVIDADLYRGKDKQSSRDG